MVRAPNQAMRAYPEKSRMFDFRLGIVGLVSDRMKSPRWVKRANNLIFRPLGAISSRLGSRSITSWPGPGANYRDNTLAKWYDPGGAGNHLFGFFSDGTTHKWYEIAGASGTAQTIPVTPSSDIWSTCGINGLLVATQHGGGNKPIFFSGSAWLSLDLPTPPAAPTTAAPSAGGAMDVGTHFYRMRWYHKNGSSRCSPTSPGSVIVGAPNQQVVLSNLHPGVPRADYLGCTIERTKASGTVAGRWYRVANVPAATPTYTDGATDAALNDEADETLHFVPQHFDGVVPYHNRLVGWDGRALYLSNLVGDVEETGICNFDGANILPVYTDDGDSIQLCVRARDRVVVFKSKSIWVLEGTTPDNFVLREIVNGVGAIGPRAADAVGGDVYFQSRRGWELLRGNRLVDDFSYTRMGHYFDTLNIGQASRTVVRVVENEYVLYCYPDGSNNRNSDIAVFDLRANNWTHWIGWAVRDALVQKDGGFGNATLLFADENAPATWAALVGNLDAVAVDGTGGTAIPLHMETPTLDEMNPDLEKEYGRFELQYRIGTGNVNVRINVESGKKQASISLVLTKVNPKWGPANPTTSVLRWGPLSPASAAAGYSSKWGSSGYGQAVSGLPTELYGRDYSLLIDALAAGPFELRGFTTDYRVTPNRGYS